MNKGFTLVELLIVVAMVGLLASFSLSLFRGVNINRGLQKGNDDVVAMLNQAKSYALSQVVNTTTCTGTLISYRVDTAANNKCFTLNQVCSNVSVTDKNCLPSNVSFTKNVNITFPIQNGSVSSSNGSIIISGTFGSRTISIDSKGVITSQ